MRIAATLFVVGLLCSNAAIAQAQSNCDCARFGADTARVRQCRASCTSTTQPLPRIVWPSAPKSPTVGPHQHPGQWERYQRRLEDYRETLDETREVIDNRLSRGEITQAEYTRQIQQYEARVNQYSRLSREISRTLQRSGP